MPSPWVGLILALGTWRLWRLAAWDDFPPIMRARDWLLGAKWIPAGPTASGDMGRWTFRRPLLAKFVTCAYCSGAWLSGAVYGLWLLWPTAMQYAMVWPALSGAVALIAARLDAP